jgi:hypothetical protein
VARYLNHSYVPKIFAIAEQKEKQNDLQDKYLSHAMLIDLIGSGGLRVEDAIGSSIRLEIMAHYGNKDNIGPGIKKMHEAEKMLSKIHRPKLTNYATTDQGAEALHTYLTQMSNVAEHFLGDAWPTRYFEKEIKPGYIEYFFGGKLPQDKMDYLMDTLPTPPAPEKTPEKTWAENRVTETPLTDKFTATTRHVDHTIPIAGGVPAIGA